MRNEQTKTQALLTSLISKSNLIVEIEQRLAVDDRLGINIGVEEGLFLRSVCSQPGIRKVVEIGTQYGCSATWMAMGLSQGAEIWTFEKDPQCLENAHKTFATEEFKAFGCHVEVYEGDARARLQEIEPQGLFDLVFIDANKAATYEYWQWALSHTRPGGYIVVDNVLLFGSVFHESCPDDVPKKMWTAMRSTLTEALQNPRVKSSLVPTTEGLLFSIVQN